jgi:hypothetical protein
MLAGILCLGAGVSSADQPALADPLATDPITADTSVTETVTPADWVWFGDFWSRAERTEAIPNRSDDLERLRARARVGVRRVFADVEFGAGLEAALGSDGDRGNRANNDNERSDDLNLDEIYLRWQFAEAAHLLLGKTSFPIRLTPMLWDDDLRPLGVSASSTFALTDDQRLSLVGGYFAGDLLYGDQSRIGAAQIGWQFRETGDFGGDVALAYLDFSDLQTLVDQGLGRTNLRSQGHLLSDYQLLDVQLGAHLRLGDWPLAVRGDWVQNLGAAANDQGGRFSAILGDSRQAYGWEFGLAIQRIQRDAVLAAFNSDDWWFHSFAQGHMPWIAYGIDEHWRLRLALFDEQRDGITHDTKRWALDLNARW